MPLVVDTLTLDPVDFLPNGAELNLSGAGFRVLDADFGEADIELELQRQAIGEVPTSYHPPNTVTALKLGVREEGEVDLPTAAHQLAQKVGEINSPGTEHWIQRDFDYKAQGEFAGSLGKRVFKATLQGLGGWQRGESPDVTLTLVTGPYWYATIESESGVFESEEGATRELICELAEVLGTVPGLIRIRINNLGEEDWLGLILAGECRDHPQDATADTTAALAYAAVDLTLLGGSTIPGGELEGSGPIVESKNPPPKLWLAMLGSEIDGVGHQTHRGVRRVWARVYDGGTTEKEAEVRLEWRALGASKWSRNSIVRIPFVDNWALVDLGECRPERAAVGDERWEWRLTVRRMEGGGAVYVHRVWALPTEQYLLVRSTPALPTPTEFAARDGFAQTAGNLNGKALPDGSGNWATEGSAKGDLATTGSGEVTRTAKEDSGFREAKAPGGTFAVVAARVSFEWSALPDKEIAVLRSGLLYGSASNVFGAYHSTKTGSSLSFFGTNYPYNWQPGVRYRLTVLIVGGVFAAGWVGTGGDELGQLVASGPISATNQSIKFVDLHSGADIITRTYDDFAAWVPDPEVVASASRSIEFRSDGVFRQHPEDDVWGEMIPEGFLPVATPSGMEGRKSRFILIPSQGDLGDLADSGDNPLSAQTLARPAYLLAREAA